MADGEPGGSTRAGEPDEVFAADVAAEEGHPHSPPPHAAPCQEVLLGRLPLPVAIAFPSRLLRHAAHRGGDCCVAIISIFFVILGGQLGGWCFCKLCEREVASTIDGIFIADSADSRRG